MAVGRRGVHEEKFKLPRSNELPTNFNVLMFRLPTVPVPEKKTVKIERDIYRIVLLLLVDVCPI